MEDDDFLAAIEADNANLPVEGLQPEPPVETAPKPEPAPAEPAQPEPANPFTPPVVEAKPDPGFVPITAMLDERERRQKIEAELAQLRASQQQQQPQVPDRWEDPDGHDAYQQQLTQSAVINAKLDISEELARDKYGDELVDRARDWALQQANIRPGFGQELLQQRNPYRYAVEQFQRNEIASQVSTDDFAQFQAWKAAQAQLLAPAPSTEAAPAIPPQTTPPRSLASAPSAGGVMTEVEQTDEEMFEETFSRN